MSSVVSAVVVFGLASHYLTYVVTRSSFPPVSGLRSWVQTRWGPDSWQAYLSACTWCAAWYIAGAVVLVTALTKSVPLPLLVWPATAGLVGALTELTEGR